MNKKNPFEEIADISKALSHPARVQILKILVDREMCICGEIVAELPLSQSTVSQHLKELKRVGLILGEVDGPRTCYCVNREKLQRAFTLFNDLFKKVYKCC